MRDNVLLLSNAQARINPTSTGTVSTNVLDLEQDSAANTLITDDQVEGFMNVVLTAYSFTSGGDEGITLEVRNADNSDLATGAEVIGSLDIPLADLAAGDKFAVPFKRQVAERYLGGWVRAKSTTLVGTVTVDAEFANNPISENESLQKVTS